MLESKRSKLALTVLRSTTQVRYLKFYSKQIVLCSLKNTAYLTHIRKKNDTKLGLAINHDKKPNKF